MTTTIRAPGTLDYVAAIRLEERLRDLPPDDEYHFDFGSMTWAQPLGMLYVSHAIRSFVAEHRRARITAVNFSEPGNACHGYCAHVGFFKAFGLDFGNQPGAARGSSTYLPITEMSVPDIKAEAFDTGRLVPEFVELKSFELAGVLTQARDGDIRAALGFSVREILRNAVEHSESDRVWFCGQWWPTKQLARIAILDEGIGLRTSLSANPYLHVRDDKDALRFALLPGISGKFFKGSTQNSWDNAGFGLYMTSALARAGGMFVMVSGGRGVDWSGSGRRYFDANLAGTAIEVELPTSAAAGLDERLEAVAKRGEHIEHVCARLLETGGLLSGDSASKLLRGDL